MADLAGALDAALRARYRVAEVKTPATQRRGLLARMNQLEKHHARKGDRPGAAAARAAQSAGVSQETWRRWRKGGQAPSAAGVRKLEGAYARQITLPAFRRSIRGQKAPDRVTVTGTIRWSSSPRKMYNATPHRTVNLDGMRAAMVRTIQAWVSAGPQAAADTFQRGASTVYRVPDDNDGSPGIQIEDDKVEVTFP